MFIIPGRCKVAEVFIVVLGRIKVADGDVVVVAAVKICFVLGKISCILTSPSWLGSIQTHCSTIAKLRTCVNFNQLLNSIL